MKNTIKTPEKLNFQTIASKALKINDVDGPTSANKFIDECVKQKHITLH